MSLSAKVLSELLKLWPKYTKEEAEKVLADKLLEGEKPCPPPKLLKTRSEDTDNGRIFYVNEETDARYLIFYIHGGAYHLEIAPPHWQLIERLARKTGAEVIVPTYRLVPFATYREAFDLIVPLYKKYAEDFPDKKIIVMGDSAGGGLSLTLAEYFKAEGIRMPDELVLLSPWIDVVMDNEEMAEYQRRDPFLSIESLSVCAKHWADDLDLHDWRVSPIYGDLKGIRNVTVFVGTAEIFYPDVVKFYHMLDEDPSNSLYVAEDMNHVFPLFPIPEAKPAVEKILEAVTR